MSGTKRTEQAGVSKEGHFLGVTAIHPLTGKEIPVYIADYVISDFAEGKIVSSYSSKQLVKHCLTL